MSRIRIVASAGMLLLTTAILGAPARRGWPAISPDGAWEMADSVDGANPLAMFSHRAAAPGWLADLADPPFLDVGAFDSRKMIRVNIGDKLLPAWTLLPSVGIPRQERDWFWRRKRLTVIGRREVALLMIAKAQLGARVWLNGKDVGEHYGCFSGSCFDLGKAIRWAAENDLVTWVGAHPAMPPETVPAGVHASGRGTRK